MADELGLLAGAKGLSEGIATGKKAGQEIAKNIEDAQKEGIELARKKTLDHIRERKEAELKKQRAIFKALDEYRQRKVISDEEHRLKTDFIKKYGTKEWEQVLRIKTDIEKLEREDQQFFNTELKKVRLVQWYCFLAALIVTLWLKFILGVI